MATIHGQLMPLPERYAILHLSDCAAPCWSGIIPGVTKAGEADKRIRSVFGSPPYKIVDDAYNNGPDNPLLRYDIFLRGEPIFTVDLIREVDSNSHVLDTVSSVGIKFNVYTDSMYSGYSFAEFHGLLGTPTFLFIRQIDPTFDADSALIYRLPGGYLKVDGNSVSEEMSLPIERRVVRGLYFYGSVTLGPTEPYFGFLKWRGLIPIQEYGKELCSNVECYWQKH
jgi:hypothetical protein